MTDVDRDVVLAAAIGYIIGYWLNVALTIILIKAVWVVSVMFGG